MKKYLFTIVTLCFSTVSCVEEWTLSSQGEDVSNVLNVEANATLSNGLLSFKASTAHFTSSISEITSFPQDSLILDLTVGDNTYTLRKTWEEYTHEDVGFIFEKRGVPSDLDNIAFKIHDKKENFNDVYAQSSFSDVITPSITVSTIKYSGEYAWMDSLYTADILIPDPADKRNYYMIAVEFFDWKGINAVKSMESKLDFLDYGDGSNWISIGYYPFSSNNPVFADSDILTSINGFDIGFSNIFSDALFDGTTFTISISFENILKSYYFNDYNVLHCNGLTPFKIHLCSMSENDYKYYKRIQHLVCKKYSIFDEPASMPSNIQGGYGYFSAFNRSEFLYFDGKIYW